MTTTLNVTVRLQRTDSGKSWGGDFTDTIEIHGDGGERIAGVANTAITLTSDIVNAGYLYIEHLDTDHPIFISLDGGSNYDMELKVGGKCLIPLKASITQFNVKTSAAAAQDFAFVVTERV